MNSPAANWSPTSTTAFVQYDAEDPTVLATGLAESWDTDAEAKTVTFVLREDAVFHSGQSLSAPKT